MHLLTPQRSGTETDKARAQAVDIDQKVAELHASRKMVEKYAQMAGAEQLLPLVADTDAVITQFSPVNAQVIAARYNSGFAAA